MLDGGHIIPEEVIRRGYKNGTINFFSSFIRIVDFWLFLNNTKYVPTFITEEYFNESTTIYDSTIWPLIKNEYGDIHK